jgi:tyrosyl-tRNA synthetase
MRSALLRDLRARELVVDMTGQDDLDHHLAEGARVVYCGFDPTADSLHVGSLLPLLALRRFQLTGHRPIVLIGGGTGLIGDPSGKAGERPLSPQDQVAVWAERLKEQTARFLDFGPGASGAELVDNYEWLSRLDVIAFLRDIGKEFPVGAMLAKESVRTRLGRAEAGLSYTEFSYQILQSYDYLELWRSRGCTIQIGGSDQWGNITAGIELIRRKTGGASYGLTLPLVTKGDGTKFGKTETGTIWLDPAKTSPYEMYQFWLNTADADVDRFLKYFTLLPLDALEDLRQARTGAPERREAQRVLAREVTALIHGEQAVREAQDIAEALFSGAVASLSLAKLDEAIRGAPRTELPMATGVMVPLVDLLMKTQLASSKRAARELLASGAVELNGERVKDPNRAVSRDAALHGRYLVLRKGKKTYHAVVVGEPGGAESHRKA